MGDRSDLRKKNKWVGGGPECGVKWVEMGLLFEKYTAPVSGTPAPKCQNRLNYPGPHMFKSSGTVRKRGRRPETGCNKLDLDVDTGPRALDLALLF